MPLALKAGFAIVAVGGVVDVVCHSVGAGDTAVALAGHLLSLLGMLVAMTGVYTSAVRARARRLSDGVGHASR